MNLVNGNGWTSELAILAGSLPNRSPPHAGDD